MIRIVDEIRMRLADDSSSEWTAFPLVPASGTYKESSEVDDVGRVTKVELSFRIFREVSGMGGNLILEVRFDNGETVQLGTEDLPVRLEFERSSYIEASCSWEKAGL